MTEQFTVEEVNLMCIFNTKNKGYLINEIMNAYQYFNDEMLEIAERTVRKLNNMSDIEFNSMEFYPE